MKTIYIAICILIGLSIKAQSDSMDIKPVFGLQIHSGTFTYYGAMNEKKLPFTSSNKLNYGLGLAVKWKFLSLNLNYDQIRFGQVLNNEISHKNFEAKGSMFGVDINVWPVIKRNYGLYVGTGLSFINYNVKTDTLDGSGNPYYYWSDGSIRNQTETYSNNFSAVKIKRDFVAETDLGNKGYLLYPIRAGLMLRFIKDVQLTFGTAFYFTNRKDADGLNSDKKNYFLYNSASVTWYFNSYDKVDKNIYNNINFKDLWVADEDKDGVNDSKDKCFGTPKGIKVNSDGCPEDDDKDGIDNHKDQEKNTDKKKLVDLEGKGHEPGNPEKDPKDDKELPEEEPVPDQAPVENKPLEVKPNE